MISKTFYVWIAVATVALLGGIYLLQNVFDLPWVLYLNTLGFGVLTLLLYRNILKANEKSPRRFVTAFMGSVTVKLLLTAVIVGILLYFDKTHKSQIAVGMMVIYLVYTLVLVKSLTNRFSA